MRIALVCPYAWDDPGGVQTHVGELGERLLGRGHEVIALAPVRSRVQQGWVRAVGRPVDLTYNRSNVPLDPRPWSSRTVRRHLRAFGPDVVHLHEPFAPSTTLWALLTAQAPLVATFHSGAAPARLYDVAGPVLRRLARRIAVRIAVSETAAEVARRRLGGRFEVVPNGVDVARFAGAAPADLGSGPKILFVGRLDERKGFPVAAEAFALLADQRPELRLVVAGDGPERSAAARLPARAREGIMFLGSVPNEDLPPIHAACDLFVAPNVGGESFGIVLVEAMAAGLPVVASAIPGFTEVLRDGIDGLLVRPGDAAATAGAIERILDEPSLAGRLAASGRERALGYSWDAVVPRVETAYARAAGRPPTTG
ncbi:MAG TPA: glycosyltransferase family 4 protein [Actinomycetota bacterium]|nr:glycosyltransferase family 4 protein [Actinomycetota bacterium]